jgi:hypothetical protein
MNPRLFGTAVALVAALATVTCKDDPTAGLTSSTATRLLVSPNPVYLSEGGTANFTASAVNDALRPIRAEITATSGDANTVTVTPNNDNPDPNGTSQLFDLAALVPGQVLVTVTAAGLSTQDTVYALPVAFGGTGSTASPQVGQQFKLYATSNLKFDATAELAFGLRDVAGSPFFNKGWPVHQHAESLTVIVPQPEEAQPAELTVLGVAVTFAPGNLFELPTADLFNVVNPYEPNDAPDPAAIFGAGEFYDGFKSGQVDNFYRITIPAGGATVEFLLDWEGAADVDLLVCDAGCNALLGGANQFATATGNHPEDGAMVLPEGTHNLWVNLYDANDDVPHLYKLTIVIN